MLALLGRSAIALGVAIALGAALRFGLIETDRAIACSDIVAAPGWCAARQVLVTLFANHLFGIAAVVAGAASFFRPRGAMPVLAALASGLALLLYNVETGAIGLLLTLFGLVRASLPPAR